MNGMVAGGWGYVVAAYAITTAILASYAIHAIAELRRALRNREHEQA